MRPFHLMSGQRAGEICARIMALSEDEVHTQLAQLWAEFGGRHKKIREFFRRRYEEVRPYLFSDRAISDERLLLVGGYFTNEYSFEAAALFNPSIVPHPDQTCLPPGSLRFVLSLRATGEGHISSVTFRTGVARYSWEYPDRHAHPVRFRTGANAPSVIPRKTCSRASWTNSPAPAPSAGKS